MDEEPDVAVTSVKSILIITSIIGNSLVCAVILKNPSLRSPINYQFVNLAIADIIYSTFIIPEMIFSRILIEHQEGLAGKVLCALQERTFTWLGAFSSVFTLDVIAMERYFVVTEPQGDIGKLTFGKLKVIIPGSWIFALILNIPEFLKLRFVKEFNFYDCTYEWPEKWMSKASNWAWYIFLFLSSTLMIGLYSRVICALWFGQNEDNEVIDQQQDALKVQKRITLKAVTISTIFVICWGSDLSFHFLRDVTTYNISPHAFTIAHVMVVFSCAAKPFAYALIDKRFGETLKEIICCRSSSFAAMEQSPREEDNVEISIHSSFASREPTANNLHQPGKGVNIHSVAVTKEVNSTTIQEKYFF